MIAGRSASQRFFGGVGLYAAIAAYVVFALFPIYWTLKISVTPERLLYSEGITFWPSHMGFSLLLKKAQKSTIDARVDGAAKRLGLDTFLQRLPRQLSGGQRQRVAMGC